MDVRDEKAERIQQKAESPQDNTEEINVTEAALRKAQELDVDLDAVKGTGSGGRIVLRDIERRIKRTHQERHNPPASDPIMATYRDLVEALEGPFKQPDVELQPLAPDEPAEWSIPDNEVGERERRRSELEE